MHLIVAGWLGLLAFSGWAAPQQHPHMEVELVAEWQAWQPGQVNWLGVALRPAPQWHTYWQNPGDSGLAPVLNWQLPAGFSPGEIAWEFPQRIVVSEITNFGYENPTLLMVPFKLSNSLSNASYTASVEVQWLVCKVDCIPGEASLSLTLPVERDAFPSPSKHAGLFADARKRIPQHLPEAKALFARQQENLVIRLDQLPELLEGQLDLFAVDETLLAPSSRPQWSRSEDSLQARVGLSDYFIDLPEHAEFVVTVNGTHAYRLSGQPGALPPSDPSRFTGYSHSLPVLLAMALLGGVLLNLMPCVFPVLSIKAVGLVHLSGSDTREARRHGWLYLCGVVLSLLAISALLLLLRASGMALGWGFQLQEPWFLAALACLMFLMGLSLLGAFEISGRWMGLGQQQTAGTSNTAALLSGFLAVVIASPCMAPLMAPALAAALSLPPLPMVAILVALGFGLALPVWLLSQFPRLARWLPRPGRWMETFKQAMAFPLFLTGIWLLSLLMDHEPALILWTLLLVLGLAFLIWLTQRGYKRTALGTLAALAAAGLWLGFMPDKPEHSLAALAEPYSVERLSEYRRRNQPVLVNMTADWCLTCQVNEQVTFRRADVAKLFQREGIGYLVGDWTHRDAAITRFLDKYQRVGVPLYVFFDARGDALLLPSLLTPSILINRLESLLDPSPRQSKTKSTAP